MGDLEYNDTVDIICTRAGFSENGTLDDRWKWSRPDVSVYTSLVQSLAASLKVSDALRLIDDICRVGVSPGEEVKVVLYFSDVEVN